MSDNRSYVNYIHLHARTRPNYPYTQRDGTTHIVFTPHELIEKLIPLIPRPRCHLVRYHGILGPAAKDRDKVVPTPPVLLAPETASAEVAGDDKAGTGESREIDITKIQRGSRLPWAVLLKSVPS